jgi:hypothetical protein
MSEDDNFASDFNKKREEEVGNDVNKDGIVDGSPESIKELGRSIGEMMGNFFSGIIDGVSKKEEVTVDTVKSEETKTEPQVLNEDDK